MNPHDPFAAALDRELKRLPELPAPATLIPRVQAAIEQRAAQPWHRRPWPQWPTPARAAALAALLAIFAAICFGAWQVSQGETFTGAARRIGAWFASLGVTVNALATLLRAGALTMKQLGPVFLTALLLMAVCVYATCIGMGTLLYKYAFARRQEN
jgi:hypothetical protein